MDIVRDAAFFALVPRSTAAAEIVRTNKKYRKPVDGTYSLVFSIGHESVNPDHLVNFGSHPTKSDVVLEEEFASPQFYFTLTDTGELMLHDSTRWPATTLEWTDSDGKIDDKYSLQGELRRRVIPRAPGQQVRIYVGQTVSFRFAWILSTNADKHRWELEKIALRQPDYGWQRGGVAVSLSSIEPRTPNTPVVPERLKHKPAIQYHTYKSLGSGSFGSVSKVVDLATGDVFAVKVCRPPELVDADETWKENIRKEVEILGMIEHANIIRLCHHQGWVVGKPVELFFRPHAGSVVDLVPRPEERRWKPTTIAPWALTLIQEMAEALAYVHGEGIIHRDVKTDNILYDYCRDGSKTFYLSDFGHAQLADNQTDQSGGAVAYMAPEASRYNTYRRASDMYSFGIVVLEVLGYYDAAEGLIGYSTDSWREKLKRFGVRDYASYHDTTFLHAHVSMAQIMHSRVKSLVDYGVLSPEVSSLLDHDADQRLSANRAIYVLNADTLL
ncbi:Protein kinase-like domain protein [Niveomyces insectorum RCEF 264]|uniref:Protein kinase-like domain protein n=1 Tax=Niveomyces insectorum RCEF 264 TaxID=1081102 RepID=A0A167X6C3_9HYPO|nr:Protein kinase-like domain protein [Niveomyces insectorum RCEF 264]